MSLPTKASANSLAEKYADYATAVGRKLARDLPIETEEAVSMALLGLVEAANKFDFNRHDPTIASLETNFKSFAYWRIRGAVIDGSRKDSFVRRRGLEKGLRFQMSSLDEYSCDTDGHMSPRLELPVEEDLPSQIDLRDAVDALEPRERAIVVGTAAGFSGREISEELAISQSRVSQVGGRARRKLTEKL